MAENTVSFTYKWKLDIIKTPNLRFLSEKVLWGASKIILSQKIPGRKKLHLSIPDCPENLSKKYSRRKKLSRWHATGVVSITDLYLLGKGYGPRDLLIAIYSQVEGFD
jgi:hypothetical protein